MNKQISMRMAAAGALAAAVLAAPACQLARQEAPPLSGPSSYALSVTLTATPDRLLQDGVSASTIQAVVQDASGQALSGQALQWNVTSSDGTTFVQPSVRSTVTDANGRATVQITAPAAPTALPSRPVTLTVTATPFSTDSGNASARAVMIELVPPIGTLPKNNAPVALFTMTPSTAMIQQAVVFDGSLSTDEGTPCGDLCVYEWDFGDGGVSFGRFSSHAFAAAGTYTVRLRVTDARGGVAATTATITITAPLFTADFSVSPTAPRSGQAVNFDAAATTLGAGASIIDYTWIWGDGETTVTAVPQQQHTYTVTAATTFVVRLTVRDTLGRSATIAKSVAITFP